MHSKSKYAGADTLYRFLSGTANKKSKLINNSSQECGFNTGKNHQHKQPYEQLSSKKTGGKVHQQQTGATNSPVDVEQHSNQEHESFYNGVSNDSKRGPNLVNKQLVLPIFPNSISNNSNHLIKPSEYLKSIVTDKRSRWVKDISCAVNSSN